MRITRKYLRTLTSSRTINGRSWYSWNQMRRRVAYMLELITLRFVGPGPICPYCRSTQYSHLGRKFFFLTAKRCDFCGLIFRWPDETLQMNARFYRHTFTELFEETTGTIGEIESGEMDRFIAARFHGVKYDYHHKLAVIQQLTGSRSGHFLDFGSGWGYIAFQAQDMGWTVEGLEINPEFASFAQNKLGIAIHTNSDFINVTQHRQKYDLILMHHVLEHLREPRHTLDVLFQLLKPGGHLIIVVPNAGGDRWNYSAAQTLGQNHISAFTRAWFYLNLPGHGFNVTHIVSAPYVFDDTREGFAETIGVRGFEIMAVAQRPSKAPYGPNLQERSTVER